MRDPIYDYRITQYDRSLIPSRFVAFLEESATGPDDWVRRSGRSLGHPGWGLVYHLLLARLDPQRPNLIIETGTNLGATTLIMAQAIADSGRIGKIRTVELEPAISLEAEQRARLAGLDEYIDFFQGNSLERLPTMLKTGDEVTVAFLDGNHFHDHVIAEFDIVEPFLQDDALVLFDNTYLIAEDDEDPRVNGALRTILARHGGNLVNLPFTSWYTPGFAIWQRRPFTLTDPPAAGSFRPGWSGS